MKKVKITNYGSYPQYQGKIGVVTSENSNVWYVQMEDGIIIRPYAPTYHQAQCVLVLEDPKPTELPIFN